MLIHLMTIPKPLLSSLTVESQGQLMLFTLLASLAATRKYLLEIWLIHCYRKVIGMLFFVSWWNEMDVNMDAALISSPPAFCCELWGDSRGSAAILQQMQGKRKSGRLKLSMLKRAERKEGNNDILNPHGQPRTPKHPLQWGEKPSLFN